MIGEAAWELFKNELGVKSRNEVLAAIGLGQRNAALDARRLMVLGHFEPIESGESVALAVAGDESAALQFGPCCRPILGDAIVGVVNQGYGSSSTPRIARCSSASGPKNNVVFMSFLQPRCAAR